MASTGQKYDPNILHTYRTYPWNKVPLPAGWREVVVGGKVHYTQNDGKTTPVHPSVFKTFNDLKALTPEQLLRIEPWQIDNTKDRSTNKQSILSTIPTPMPRDKKSEMILNLIIASVESYNTIDNLTIDLQEKINRLFKIKEVCRQALLVLEYDINHPPPRVNISAFMPPPPTGKPKGGSRRKNRKTGKKINTKRHKHQRTHRRR